MLRIYPFKNVKNMRSYIVNKIKINFYLVSNQSLYWSHNSVCHLYTSYAYNNNCSQIFIAETFEPKIILFSHATYLHTRLTEFFLNHVLSSHATELSLNLTYGLNTRLTKLWLSHWILLCLAFYIAWSAVWWMHL